MAEALHSHNTKTAPDLLRKKKKQKKNRSHKRSEQIASLAALSLQVSRPVAVVEG